MAKSHENYRELVLRLAKTDFKLRYHASVLGYAWAILKPLLMFAVLNFVFSTLFHLGGAADPYYPLELLTGLLLFNFFAEGTMMGMMSLVSKAQLVTKIYVPRWTIVLGSTINAFFVFCMNLIVLVFFFFIYHKVPTLWGIIMFLIYAILLYVLTVSFSFLTAPFFVRFRDLSMIWEVLTTVLMYSAPIVYTMTMVPARFQTIFLLNPLAFIVNFSKQGLIFNQYASIRHFLGFFFSVMIVAIISFLIFKKYEKKVAELI
jgi:ABC-2 type transport system permease protein